MHHWEKSTETINLPVNLWGNLSIIHRICSLFFALHHLHNGCYCVLSSQSFLSLGPALSFSRAGAEQKTRALTQSFQGTLGQLWLQMFACDGSHWTWCAWHMEAIRSHWGCKGQDALCCSSQIPAAVSGVWCCGSGVRAQEIRWAQLMVLSMNLQTGPSCWAELVHERFWEYPEILGKKQDLAHLS